MLISTTELPAHDIGSRGTRCCKEARAESRSQLSARLPEELPDQGAGLGWNLRSGLAVEIRDLADWIVYCDIFVDGEYDTAIDHCLASASAHRPLQILDLGANVGFFTMRFVDRMLRSDPQRPYQATLVEGSPRVAAELKPARFRKSGGEVARPGFSRARRQACGHGRNR